MPPLAPPLRPADAYGQNPLRERSAKRQPYLPFGYRASRISIFNLNQHVYSCTPRYEMAIALNASAFRFLSEARKANKGTG